ncbi:MAG: D-alanyl-D-alanine carboxypeptidase/D-alanyl-D-alanine-endopeptidase [Candidatus Eremiobacteraeota bacterium]|nr:D-alanyl-D-alanine carboxypeptidase/D-alanyl-D-alanine-endopeptidase [Candidatus Eremiobacteraeota bacterium]
MFNFIKPAMVLVLGLFAMAPAQAVDMSSVQTLVKPGTGGAPWTAAQITRLHTDIEQMLKAPTLRGAHLGFIAVDTKTGKLLYSRNADDDLMPASNFKLLVGSTALARLGTDFVYKTQVFSDGSNLYLHGGGDVQLLPKDLDDAAAALAAQGIKTVSGAVITDASYYDSQRYGYGWSWDDLPYYYAPVVTALNLDDNVVHIRFSPGTTLGAPMQLHISPVSSAYTIENAATTGTASSKDTTDIVRPWDKPRTIEITGNYPLGSKESGDVDPAVPDPESLAGDVFLQALQANGITVAGATHSGVTPAVAKLLWSHDSQRFPQLLAQFWYPSDNLMGEVMLKQLGVLHSGAPGTDTNGIPIEQAFLKSIGVDPGTVTVADGSGLSQYDRITPRDLLTILQADWRSPNRDVVLNALPVSGVRGTLAHSYTGSLLTKRIFAKTGSISHVRTISGYLRTLHHGAVTFSFMLNDWMDEDAPHGGQRLAKVREAMFSRIVND